MIPVLFLGRYAHEGNALPFINDSLSQAKKRGNSLILLGEKEKSPVDNYYPLESYETTVKEFDAAYRHLAFYKEPFARMSFRRWFVIKDFMVKENIKDLFLCENDVLLYQNVTEVLSNTEKSALSKPLEQTEYEWCSSGHCAYWRRADLEEFCEFTLETYRDNLAKLEEKWTYHQKHNLPGGVCDMTLLYLFHERKNLGNLNEVHRGSFFDHNIEVSRNAYENEYERGLNRIKKVTWKDGKLYAYNHKMNKNILVNSLHFSGNAKKFLHIHTSENILKQYWLRFLWVSIIKARSRIQR